MTRVAFLILTLLVTSCPVVGAKTIDLDAATIADINAAFKTGTLTAEELVQLCLARIRSFDREGPSLHAVMVLNPRALETARELDAERKAKGPRSALHGIPVVLKNNYNTADLPTTGGSVLLEGSIPPTDAFVVKKLRDAGAIILGKMNMSEFASPPSQSSLGGQSLNPHDLTRSPAGSSCLSRAISRSSPTTRRSATFTFAGRCSAAPARSTGCRATSACGRPRSCY